MCDGAQRRAEEKEQMMEEALRPAPSSVPSLQETQGVITADR